MPRGAVSSTHSSCVCAAQSSWEIHLAKRRRQYQTCFILWSIPSEASFLSRFFLTAEQIAARCAVLSSFLVSTLLQKIAQERSNFLRDKKKHIRNTIKDSVAIFLLILYQIIRILFLENLILEPVTVCKYSFADGRSQLKQKLVNLCAKPNTFEVNGPKKKTFYHFFSNTVVLQTGKYVNHSINSHSLNYSALIFLSTLST